jgi:hypothetical protein
MPLPMTRTDRAIPSATRTSRTQMPRASVIRSPRVQDQPEEEVIAPAHAFDVLAGAAEDVLGEIVQASASFWAQTRDEAGVKPRVACIQKFGNGLRAEVMDLAGRCQDILIDAGGRDSVELRASARRDGTRLHPHPGLAVRCLDPEPRERSREDRQGLQLRFPGVHRLESHLAQPLGH